MIDDTILSQKVTLTKSVDFEYSYENNVEVGEATVVAMVGLAVNLASAALLGAGHHHHGHGHGGHDHAHHDHDHSHHDHDHHSGHSRDNNLRSAYMHVLADALEAGHWPEPEALPQAELGPRFGFVVSPQALASDAA